MDEKNLKPIFTYTYYFEESKRADADSKIDAKASDILLGLNQTLPNVIDIFKKRYKECKSIGDDLLKSGPNVPTFEGELKPNDSCPCGSGKKYKKCCADKLN